MGIYTKDGDNGLTTLHKVKNVSKSDDRVELIGAAEELSCHLGLIRADEPDLSVRAVLEEIQANLGRLSRWVGDPYHKDHKLSPDCLSRLEQAIDRLEELGAAQGYIPGSGINSRAAVVDLAWAVARRAERRLVESDKKYGGDKLVKAYMNRLSDYLYMLAAYYGQKEESGIPDTLPAVSKAEKGAVQMTSDEVVQAVLEKMGQPGRISLAMAKQLADRVEQYAADQGLAAVIAVCGPDGHMIAVHTMDGALLASFDVAVKKAYTAVAVRMSTLELGRLAVPGGTFYGVDKADNGRLIIFGGGIPLKAGEQIIGGLGISGGTGEKDDEIASYGQAVLQELLKSP